MRVQGTLLVVLVGLVLLADLITVSRAEDSPYEAWEEWGETADSKREGYKRPKHQPKVELKPGRKINVDALMGSIPKKMTLFFAKGEFGDADDCHILQARWNKQMRLGGVEASVNCVKDKATLVGRAESQRDAHNAKDFLLRNREVQSIKIESTEYTEPAKGINDELDDDDDDL